MVSVVEAAGTLLELRLHIDSVTDGDVVCHKLVLKAGATP